MPWQWYKPNQGRQVRLTAIVAVVLFGLLAAVEVYVALGGYDLKVKLAAPEAVLAGVTVSGLYVLNRPRVADFLIDTQAELAKVSWPSRQQVLGSTWAVLLVVMLLGLYLLGLDKLVELLLRRLLGIYQ